ncbi:MAG: hypothetical protein KJZ85_19045 [Rhodobacteraceae bacterium]|jgi:hypothetical protein|nr:hypothetical protein [Paracoccaceae bacterium]
MPKTAGLLAVLVLTLAPSLAAAMCMEGHAPVLQTTSPCEQGQVWDAATQTCSAPVHG